MGANKTLDPARGTGKSIGDVAPMLMASNAPQPQTLLSDTTAPTAADAQGAQFFQDHPLSIVIEGYEIIRELSRGGQGVVYQAVQKSTRRKVAIKVLMEGPYASKAARRRFEREVDLAANLKPPHIIAVFDSGTTADGHLFYVMDCHHLPAIPARPRRCAETIS